jgi:hypothetical protein
LKQHQKSFSCVAAVRWRTLAARKFDGIYDGISGTYRRFIRRGDTVMALTDTRIRNAKPQAKA